MADVAFRSDDLAFQPRRFWRGRASGRGGFDRFALRTEVGVDRPRGEGGVRPVPWPVVPRREAAYETMVAPSSTIPAVVALPRVTTAAPHAVDDDARVPAIRIAAEARCPLPVDLRRRGLGVVAAVLTHLLCLAALLAMPRIEASGGGNETEAVEIAIVFAEASLDAEAGAASAPREATPEPLPPEPLAPEPVTAEPPPLDPPPQVVATVEPPPEPVPPPPVAEPLSPEPVRLTEVDLPPLPVEPPVLATAAPAETAVPPPPIAPIATPVEAPAPSLPAARIERPKPPAPVKPKRQPVEAERRVEAKPRPAAPVPPGHAARDSTSGARAAGASAAAGVGAVSDWRAAVLAALARAKRYPDDARDRGVTGRAVVGFTLSRDGSVTSVSLVASSGVPALDAATLAMPRRAAFPPMPAGGPPTQSFTAGVRYDLR